MPYTVKEKRNYEYPAQRVSEAAKGAVEGLEGKLETADAEKITAKFNKTILGKVLGDRTEINVVFTENGGSTEVSAEIFPLDALERKLMFGARKGVSETVMNWFFAHLEHRLKA